MDTKRLNARYTRNDMVVNVEKIIRVAGGDGFDRQDWHFLLLHFVPQWHTQ